MWLITRLFFARPARRAASQIAPAPSARQPRDDFFESLLARGDSVWVMDELMEAWRSAETDARRAYDMWGSYGGANAYTAYRAEQDRADAAQDAVAEWAVTQSSVRGSPRACANRRVSASAGGEGHILALADDHRHHNDGRRDDA